MKRHFYLLVKWLNYIQLDIKLRHMFDHHYDVNDVTKSANLTV